MIVTWLGPRLEIVDGGSTVRLHLNEQHSVLIQTTLEARQLGDLCRQAEHYLDERARLIASRMDRDASVLTNAAFEQTNREWPGGTFAPVSQSHIQRIPITACDCSRTTLCAVHGGAA